MTVRSPASLEDVVAQAAALEAAGVRPPFTVRDEPGDGFAPADRLHAPGPLLDACVEDAAAAAGTEHLHVGAQWWFEGCAWLVASTAVACALTSGRVPSFAPADVLLARAGGAAVGLAVRSTAPVPVTGSPGAVSSHVSGAAAKQALAVRVRLEVEAHLGPLVAALAARRLRPAAALWRAGGDRVVQACLWAGTATERRREALALAHAVLAPSSPLHVPVRVVQDAATGAPSHLRRSCCLAHRLPRTDACAVCPRVHLRDRGRGSAARVSPRA